MLTDPVNTTPNHWGLMIGNALQIDPDPTGFDDWNETIYQGKDESCLDDCIHLKTNSPSGKRYAY